ncbi:FtsX-like permease family protein [Parashewanella curva]|uniref:FtsX-like permease family protein n=1 Tax=Parashewanella curva TaxID=2338552 RepID=A0A3L8Q3C6_9GAMM|nr:FtsX-like permease family protein [Parashewanella curva]RLV61688.1 FtsX-like permease family protein [Parashewanella curva]
MLNIKPIISALWRSKSGPVLLLLQIILSVAIVANASFIIHERLQKMNRESGIAEAEVFTVNIYNFGENVDYDLQRRKDIEAIKNLPDVKNASLVSMIPMSGSGWSSSFTREAFDRNKENQEEVSAGIFFNDHNFIDTLGLKLIEGRNFRIEEIDYSPNAKDVKAIVSRAFATAMWGEGPAVGKTFFNGPDESAEVVGVLEYLQGDSVGRSTFQHGVIFSYDFVRAGKNAIYAVRANPKDIPQLKKDIKDALLADNPYRVFQGFETIAEIRVDAYRNDALMVTALSMIIVLLLVIASLGLSGMVMFNIQKRTKQIGTRRALGAKKRDIIQQFLVENYLICSLGALLGGILAMQLGSQLMRHYDLPMLDLSYVFVTVAGLFVVTTIAVLLPARKAAAISPAIATRSV